jgi:hypothetical protein
MHKDIRYVIDEMLAKAKEKKDNGPITISADNLWKYSGEVEPYNEDYARLMQENHKTRHFMDYYKLRIKNKNIYLLLNSKESKVIDYFYQNCSTLNIKEMSIDLKLPVEYIRQVISKQLKIQQNDKKKST